MFSRETWEVLGTGDGRSLRTHRGWNIQRQVVPAFFCWRFQPKRPLRNTTKKIDTKPQTKCNMNILRVELFIGKKKSGWDVEGLFGYVPEVCLEPGSVDQDPNQVMAEAPHLNFGRMLCGVGDGKNDGKLFVIDSNINIYIIYIRVSVYLESIHVDSGMNLTSTDLLCLSCHHWHIHIDGV